jgi:RHS repeat-associated protein
VALPNDVAPGEQVTFSFNATAPTTPGTYNFQWQMLREGLAAFGAASPNVAVSVNGANDSSFLSQSVPEVMGTSQSSSVSVTLRNTGTTTWTPGSYFLGSENPEANTTWGTNRAELASPVAPGAIVTVDFNITSPAAVGAYNFQWRMVQNSTRFGAFTENASVTVSDADGAAFVSQSVPVVMAPGQTYPVSVTLRNTGGTTWAPGTYFLGSENPEANTTWGTNRVDLAVPIGPGAYVTLAFNVTAPSAVGVYNFQWRMVNNSTRFGAYTTNYPVDVVQGQAQTLYFVHADHLNTPRLVADATGTTVWRWDQGEPFGNNVADENPSGLGAFDLPLRLPGQYFDKETNLHYNYFRDYDPSIGRYGESDPIGMQGGINTYNYVGGRPLSRVDPTGLKARICCKVIRRLPLSFLFPFFHCFIDEVADSCCGSKTRTVGLHGPSPWGNSRYEDAGEIRPNDDFDKPNESECGDWNPDCGVGKCIDQEIAKYPDPSVYRPVRGPNSNTFAGTLSRACMLPKPENTDPAPAWHDKPAEPKR